MARAGVHMLENRLWREQSWQKVTDINLSVPEQVVKNKRDHEIQKSRMGA